MTIKELADRWLELKRMEITQNAHNRYTSYIKICAEILGEATTVGFVCNEDILLLRKELLTGYQICGKYQINPSLKKGMTVRTVNVYMSCLAGMFRFAVQNDYAP